MKLVFRPALFLWLLYSTSPSLGVRIQSVPSVDSEGFIHTELNRTVSLVCQPESDSATEELVWRRNGAEVHLTEENKKGSSSVCVTPVVSDDNGATFTCHLRTNATVTASVTLNVTFAPALHASEEVAVEEEAELVLQCDIFANPPVPSVTWTLNGTTVDLIAGGFTLTNNGYISRLMASEVKKSIHEGRYQCTAASPIYGAWSKSFYVTVTGKNTEFPLMPIIAGLVVVCLTGLLAVVSRWNRITKCCK